MDALSGMLDVDLHVIPEASRSSELPAPPELSSAQKLFGERCFSSPSVEGMGPTSSSTQPALTSTRPSDEPEESPMAWHPLCGFDDWYDLGAHLRAKQARMPVKSPNDVQKVLLCLHCLA